MKGFSDNLLKNHFKLYSGYVANTNKVLDKLNIMLKEGKTKEYEYAELKRRLGWEFNGMRLHELYFGNLGGNGELRSGTKIYKKIALDFGNFEYWKQDFVSTGSMRGIGWVVLYYDKTGDRLINMWINEHDVGHPAGCVPLLVMDVFEHAFISDYGLAKTKYIEAFFENINWQAVEKRF
ncbi:superoxide dismutase [candidate division KSB1 bacterium]